MKSFIETTFFPRTRNASFSVEPKTGRSSAWLERYVRDVEVARSNRVAPINREVNASRFFYFLPLLVFSPRFFSRPPFRDARPSLALLFYHASTYFLLAVLFPRRFKRRPFPAFQKRFRNRRRPASPILPSLPAPPVFANRRDRSRRPSRNAVDGLEPLDRTRRLRIMKISRVPGRRRRAVGRTLDSNSLENLERQAIQRRKGSP